MKLKHCLFEITSLITVVVLLAGVVLLARTAVAADDMDPAFNGLWGSVENESRGWSITVPDQVKSTGYAGLYFAYDRVGEQVWLIASGEDHHSLAVHRPVDMQLGRQSGYAEIEVLDNNHIAVTLELLDGFGDSDTVDMLCDTIEPVPGGLGCTFSEVYYRITQPVPFLE